MGYVGNQVTNSYTSLDKQVITGDGGASYTLDHAVANENEIECFVNNVRQEPSVAYTVSGSALTMTGNVAASDDFYVVFQGKAIQTTSHPEGQDLQARDGTFSGDLSVTGALDVDGLVKLGKNDGTVDARVIFEGDSSDGDGWIGIPSWDTDAVHIYSPNGSGGNAQRMIFTDDGNVRITGGLYVGGSASSNLLDDYEEGTWTPQANGVDMTNISRCTYTKVGRLVTLLFDATLPTGAASVFSMSNLPFVCNANNYGIVNVSYANGSSGIEGGYVNIGTTYINFVVAGSGANDSLPANNRIIGSAVYFT